MFGINALEKKHKYINGTRGVISLFLAILMLPFVMIAGALINAGRINSAVAIFDEALCNASDSTLGTYDSFLKKRFGLLAMSQNLSGKGATAYSVDDLLAETFDKYMQENLGVLSNTYQDYKAMVTGVYPLAASDVLGAQIQQTGKITVPVRMVSDMLSVDAIIKQIRNSIPGHNFFSAISSGFGAVGSIETLINDHGLLETAVGDQETAVSEYNNAYTAFESAVNNYLSAVVSISEYETAIANDKAEMTSEQVSDTLRIRELDNLISSTYNSELRASYIEERTLIYDKYTEQEDLDKIKQLISDVDAKERIENSLDSKIAAVDSAKSTYSSKITALRGKLESVSEKLSKVQGDVVALGSNIESTAVETVNGIINQENEQLRNDNKVLTETNTQLQDEDFKLINQSIIDDNNKTINDNTDTTSTISAIKDGTNGSINKYKQKLKDFDTSIYSNAIAELDAIKIRLDGQRQADGTQSGGFDVTKISSLSKSLYYASVAELLNVAAVKEAESAIVEDVTSASIWAIIQAVFDFIDALLSVSFFYDGNLNALIDDSYYSSDGGLPSERDRTTHPLSMGNDSDAMASQGWKDLFGAYSSSSGSAFGSYDVVTCVAILFTSFNALKNDILSIIGLVGLFKLKETINNLQSHWNLFKGAFESIFNFLRTLSPVQKGILSGWAAYSTSCRTTYTGSNPLNDCKYNYREQYQPTGFMSQTYNNIGALLDVVSDLSIDNVTSEMCFYGAETEYLLFGNKNEAVNQVIAFLVVMATRIPTNLFAVFRNQEVKAVAEALSAIPYVGLIVAVLYYVFLFFLECFLDTVLLVNGGEVEFWKSGVYLTAGGIESFVRALINLPSLSSSVSSKLQSQEDLFSQAYQGKSITPSSYNPKGEWFEGVFKVSYQDILFIALTLFVSDEVILSRMSDIIEMEACYYYDHQTGFDGKFNLDNSYTFLRVQANFKSSEFIPISENSLLTSKDRVIYRGY